MERLGFVVTPPSDHPFGTSNRLVVLDGIYLEFVTVTRPAAIPRSGFARSIADDLAAGRIGPRMIALRTDDALAEVARLQQANISTDSPLRFGRDAVLPDGASRRVDFEVVFPRVEEEEVNVFFCRHLTLEAIWHQSAMAHPNGARRLSSLRIPVDDPAWWDRLRLLAAVPSGSGVVLGDTTLAPGGAGLVIEAGTSNATSLAGTSIELGLAPSR